MQAFAQLSNADPSVGRSPRGTRLAKKFGVQLAHLRQRTPFALIIDLARVGLLELGGQVAIDLKADADFHESGGCPNHETFLRFSITAYDSDRSVR
jgi:hypothetical protein